MIAKLVCAGVDAFKEIYAPDENEILVGVDGGALKIIEAGYKPKIAIGDFDSGNLLLIARHAERMIIHPEKKDHGDLELAIQEIAPLEPEKILIYDSTGGRLDHFLAALNILICFLT